MKWRDIITMAFHNLWSRKSRTVMNLIGIVLGCVVLLLTLAGTRGVTKSIQSLVEGSPDAKRFAFYRGHDSSIDPPDDVVSVSDQVPEDRRERIHERLKQEWRRKNAPEVQLGETELKNLNDIPHIVDIIPSSYISGVFSIPNIHGTESQSMEPMEFTATGISLVDENVKKQTYIGEHLRPDDFDGIVISDFTAYQLGYVTDEDLLSLVGKPITLQVQTRGQRLNGIVQNSNWQNEEQIDAVSAVAAMKKLVDELDTLSISEDQKSLLKKIFAPADSELEGKALYIEKEFIIRGVFRPLPNDRSLLSILKSIGYPSYHDFFLHHSVATEIQMSGDQFKTFHGAIGTVDDIEHLESVIDEIESRGYRSQSSLRFIKYFQRDVVNVKLGASAMSLLILMISAVGISNTMVVSVLERMGEFGILKAIGARDRHIMLLMVIEGTLTGLLGALISIAVSIGISRLVASIVQWQLTKQLDHDYLGNVFSFAISDFMIILGVAAIVCTLASLLPAWRAAKLDPVVAMNRS